MPIQVVCDCGKKLTVKDELAGRRVRCPGCQEAICVPRAESRDDDWELDDSDEDDAPVKARRSRAGKGAATGGAGSRKGISKAKSSSGGNPGLMFGLAAGGGVLVIVIVAWLLWPAAPQDAAPLAANNASGGPVAPEAVGAASMTSAATPSMGNVPESLTSPVQSTVPGAMSAAAGAVTPVGELGLLQGDWYVADIEADLEPSEAERVIPIIKQFSWSVEGDILAMKRPDGEVTMASTVKLDTKQSPRTMDLIPLPGADARPTGRAIYVLDGDAWKVCLTNTGDVRPTAMKADRTTGAMLVTLKKGNRPDNSAAGGPDTNTTRPQFDFEAWRKASARLKEMKVMAILNTRQPTDPTFPPGVTHCVFIDPPESADGSISPELWSVMSSVTYLVVRTKSISDVSLNQITQHPGLLGVNISGRSTVTATGIAELKKCPLMRNFHTSGIPVSAEVLDAITQLGELRTFGIADAPVSGAMVSSIARLESLEFLRLQNTGVMDDDLDQIARLPKLRSLLIGKSNVTDKGLEALSSLKLQTLFLDETKVTDAGLLSLKGQSELTLLNVRGVNLSPQALAEFSSALPKCRLLK